jgi:hypothetical protein
MMKCKKCKEEWIAETRGKIYHECPYCGRKNDPKNPIVVEKEYKKRVDLKSYLENAQKNREK